MVDALVVLDRLAVYLIFAFELRGLDIPEQSSPHGEEYVEAYAAVDISAQA